MRSEKNCQTHNTRACSELETTQSLEERVSMFESQVASLIDENNQLRTALEQLRTDLNNVNETVESLQRTSLALAVIICEKTRFYGSLFLPIAQYQPLS